MTRRNPARKALALGLAGWYLLLGAGFVLPHLCLPLSPHAHFAGGDRSVIGPEHAGTAGANHHRCPACVWGVSSLGVEARTAHLAPVEADADRASAIVLVPAGLAPTPNSARAPPTTG